MDDKAVLNVSGEQTFKSGVKDLVVHALDGGGNAVLKDCRLTLQDDTLVNFEIEVRVKEIITPVANVMKQ